VNKRTETKIRNAAKRGAKKLDKLAPGVWFKPNMIALGRFDIRSGSSCIAGQLLGLPGGDFPSAAEEKRAIQREEFWQEVNGGFIEAMRNYDYKFGFNATEEFEGEGVYVTFHEIQIQYDILQDEWEKQILERRAVSA
jgi:hypothetical protein